MKHLAILTALLALLFSASAFAELPITVSDALKKAGISQTSVGVYVQAVDAENPIISHNAYQSFNPASVMKLVTTNAALDLLTPAYRWKTEVYRDGEVKDGILNGNLIIKGYGDPSFKAQDFWRLLMRLQQAGIHEIKGDLIIDKSFFAENSSKIAFDNEIWRAYNAQPSAFLVNGRHTSFRFSVGDTSINIDQEFELSEIKIVNKMQLGQTVCADWRSGFGYTVKPEPIGTTVTFEGTFSASCGERYLELSVLSDEQYAFYTFKKLWRELGGVFNGNLKLQQLSTNAIKLNEHLSEPLAYVIRDMNKWSNNVTAKQLLLTLGAKNLGLPATETEGALAIERWLESKKIDAQELVIENGSGLSRIERINSAHLGQMLVSAYNSPVMPELLASLPILSLDGTAQKRLKDSPAQKRAHVKTGSIEGVSAVAGFLLNSENKRYAFVMIVNHSESAASKSAQDALINWIYAH